MIDSIGVAIPRNLQKKVASCIGAIKRVRNLVPQTKLKSIIQALIQPSFDYCNSVWDNCGGILQEKI